MAKRPEFNDIDVTLEAMRRAREKNRHQEPLEQVADSAGLAEYLQRNRAALIAQIKSGTGPADPRMSTMSGLEMSHQFSDLIDAILQRMFVLACRQAGINPTTLPLAIAATGGYGRQELAPYSDIDLTFIPQRDGDPKTDRIVRELFRMVMDVFIAKNGLEVGYAYRLFSDCGNLDHQTISGLLDIRQIAGHERLFIQFEDAFWLGFNPTEFIFAKIEEREAALKKWGRFPRCVEPQLKEGAGGLRDLHTAVWLVQARQQLAAARVRGKRAFQTLAVEAGLSPSEISQLMQAKQQLFRVRNALHAVSGGTRDQLVVTRQEEIADLLGYTQADPEGVPAVEAFMGQLFPLLATVRRVADQVMRKVGNSRLMLGIGLDCKRRQIVPANDALHSDDPVWLIWACELAQRYELELSEAIEEAAVALVGLQAITRETDQAASVFTQILARIGRVYPVLQKMADLKILNWLLPEFSGLMDLIPYDASHDYTVGQHSLLVIRHLEELLVPDGTEEQAEMRRALQELTHPEYLILAALLHDSGKAKPGLPHAAESALIAEKVCHRLGWSEEATDHVRFLVREHLQMGETSRLRDLNREETVRDFVKIVEEPERLNMLYLLTYADTKAVGEGIWTPVKGRFLRELWQRAMAALYATEPDSDRVDTVEQARRRLLKDLALEKFPTAEVQEHIEAMPPYYLFSRSLQEVALHLGFIRRVRSGEIVVDFHDERTASYTELTLCTYDDPLPGLLAKIAGVLYASGLNVHSAQVVTRVTERDRIALDTLLVDYRGRPLSLGKRQELTNSLTAVLCGAKTLTDLMHSKTGSALRQSQKLREGVLPVLIVESARNDLVDGMTVVDVSGQASVDLFYRVCQGLSKCGWDIHSAKLSATRDLVRASFYVAGARHMAEYEVKRCLAYALESHSKA